MDLPQRKPIRLKNYDYSSAGVYFITVCTDKRKNFFWSDVGANIVRPYEKLLSDYGIIAKNAVEIIPEKYDCISIDNYVIMPNHIHFLIRINGNNSGRTMFAPTISQVIKQYKGAVSKEIGFSIWQKGFYDHIVRCENDYNEIFDYIERNPDEWQNDKLFIEKKC